MESILNDENNFIDSLGLGRDTSPDPSALKPSKCKLSRFKIKYAKKKIQLEATKNTIILFA
jgi:hypothetical protein